MSHLSCHFGSKTGNYVSLRDWVPYGSASTIKNKLFITQRHKGHEGGVGALLGVCLTQRRRDAEV